MPTYRAQRRVLYSPRQMFDVVADVERYPEFLPLCEGLKVTSRVAKGEITELVAIMSIGYKAIRESFTTRVRLDAAAPGINVTYVDGPFSHLDNEWRFLATDSGCTIDFMIDYEFRSLMLSLVAGAAFDKAIRSYTEAFEARARALYASA